MILSRKNLAKITAAGLVLPPSSTFDLPEKVLQFGTGVLLRALPDYFIDKANRLGVFNGRIVVIKSTSTGSSSAFEEQDALYTLVVKGIENGKTIEENIICSAISRVIAASSHWNDILACAEKKEMQIIISNTTEVGLQLTLEDINQMPPVSFPAKLLAFLVARYKAFNGSIDSGMVIIPTELIPDNGKKLRSMMLELAHFNTLDAGFVQWLKDSNHFCSSLVDRIVPGKPDEQTMTQVKNQFGYNDELLVASEAYRLWAIEGNEKVSAILTFAQADDGVIIAPDIEIYRELKLRLLNATHTLTCGTAFLAGFDVVREAMNDDTLLGYSSMLMIDEISEAIPYPIEENLRNEFAHKVLDRFKNPSIKHVWLSITLQYSMKLKMRVLPVLFQYYKNFNKAPRAIALGLAAWMLFMKAVKKDGNKYFGDRNGTLYAINDDQSGYFYDQWQRYGEANIVIAVLKDQSFWGADLTALPGFAHEVDLMLQRIMDQGILQTIREIKK